MSDDVIYEGKYSDLLKKLGELPEDGESSISSAITGGDTVGYMRKVLENSVSVFMPNRVERKNKFLKAAKEVAEDYLIDVVFSSHDNHIAVTYTLDCGPDFRCLKEIISQADGISFEIDQGKILLSLRFYTHATYLSGRKISPQDD